MPRRLLVLYTGEGNENLKGFVVDPELERRLASAGWRVEGRAFGELTAAHFDAAHAVVMIQQPYAVNQPGLENFRRALPLIDAYLRRGGGVVSLFDDRYFTVFEPMNHWLAGYGAQLLHETVEESSADRRGEMDHDPMVRWLVVDAAADHPVTRGLQTLRVPITADGKMAYPLQTDGSWRVLVAGSPTARSVAQWGDGSSSFATAPPLAAAHLTEGDGRLVVISTHSTLSFLHGSHPRWDGGMLLDHGLGQLLTQAIGWVSEAPHQARGELPAAVHRLADDTPFRPVPESDQQPARVWQRGVVVVLESEPEDLAEWTRAAKAGLDWLALVLPDEVMRSGEDHQRWVRRCEEASSSALALVPGGAMRDSFGNRAAFIRPEKWPSTRTNGVINHLARDVLGHPIVLEADRNPWPWETLGGFQGMAVLQYRDGAWGSPLLDDFRQAQAHDWFLTPHVVMYGDDPAVLAEHLERGGAVTYVAAPRAREVPDYLPYLFHNRRDVFVSDGPVIERIVMGGRWLVEDPWEGRYLIWNGVDSRAEFMLNVSLPAGQRGEARVLRNGAVWRRYPLAGERLDRTISIGSDQAAASYWLEIHDDDGLSAISAPTRTRAREHWSHGGGDRMNTYSGLRLPVDAGGHKVHGRSVSSFGGVWFNLGWGDTLDPRPPLDPLHLTPAGREWGPPAGGVGVVRVIPRIRYGGHDEYGRARPRRYGYDLAGEQAAVVRETIDRAERNVDGERVVGPARLFTAEGTYTVMRWRPDGMIAVLVETDVEPVEGIHFEKGVLVRLAEFVAKSDRWMSHLSTGRVGGKGMEVQRQDLADDGPTAARGVSWAAVWPDPLLSLAVYQLGEDAAQVEVRPSTQGPRVAWSVAVPTDRWQSTGPTRFRTMLAFLAGNHPDPEKAFADAAERWQEPSAAEALRLTRGELRRWAGVVDIAADRGVAEGTLTLDESLVPLGVRFGGLARQRPAYLRDLSDDRLVRLDLLDDVGHFTWFGGRAPLRFVAGELVDADRPELRVDPVSLTDRRLTLQLHNPTDAALRVTLRPTAVWPVACDARTLTLAAGEDRTVQFTERPSHD